MAKKAEPGFKNSIELHQNFGERTKENFEISYITLKIHGNEIKFLKFHTEYYIRALFRSEFFLNFDTVALLFLFDKNCSIIK